MQPCAGLRGRCICSQKRGAVHYFVRENDEPITSVRFLASVSDAKTYYMIVCGNSSITCYVVPLKGEPKVSLSRFV